MNFEQLVMELKSLLTKMESFAVGYRQQSSIFQYNMTCIIVFIENTSWKVLAYGIYTRVVFVSEIERVSAANEWDFWYKNNEWVNTVRSTLHVVLCLLYTYWDIHHFGGLFILNLSKMLKFAATHHEITMKTKYQLFSRNVS